MQKASEEKKRKVLLILGLIFDVGLTKMLDAEKKAIELMLEIDNIHLFSFFDEFELICNVDNYKDTLHYHEDINSYIFQCMKNGEHELTKENYEEYCDSIKEFYLSYDYDQLFK